MTQKISSGSCCCDARGIEQTTVRLERRITLLNACAIVVGIIVGSGIFISPKGILEYTGSPFLSLLLWAACAVSNTLGALCYAELAAMIPKSGGEYAYIREAFGPFLSFIYLWISLAIFLPVANTIVALTFANYVLAPFLQVGCSAPPEMSVRMIAAAIILLLTFINCYSVPLATRLQDWLSLGKVAAMATIIAAALAYVTFLGGNTGNLQWERLTAGSRYELGQISLAFYAGGFTYSGWTCLNFVTEEIRDPKKNVPRALCISLAFVALIYIMVNLAYFTVLTPAEILASRAVAVTFMKKVIGPVAPIMSLFVLISCIGTLHGQIFTSARMFFAGARDGLLPESLAMINVTTLTPAPSLIFLGLLSIAMLTIDNIEVLLNYFGFAQMMIFLCTVGGLLKMRWFRPDIERPIKLNISIPLLYISFVVFVIVVSLSQGLTELIAAAVLSASGVPIYFLFIERRHPKAIYKYWVSGTRCLQKLLIAVTEDDEKKEAKT